MTKRYKEDIHGGRRTLLTSVYVNLRNNSNKTLPEPIGSRSLPVNEYVTLLGSIRKNHGYARERRLLFGHSTSRWYGVNEFYCDVYFAVGSPLSWHTSIRRFHTNLFTTSFWYSREPSYSCDNETCTKSLHFMQKCLENRLGDRLQLVKTNTYAVNVLWFCL